MVNTAQERNEILHLLCPIQKGNRRFNFVDEKETEETAVDNRERSLV